MRGMMIGNKDEYYLRQQQNKKKKQQEDEEDRKRLVNVEELERKEREAANAKKRELYNIQKDDYDNFKKRKNLENQMRADEDQKSLKLMEGELDKWEKPGLLFYDRLRKNNDGLLNKMSAYNNLLGNVIDPRAFDAKNDMEFNKIVAEQREKERRNRKMNPEGLQERLIANDHLREQDLKDRENKLNKEKLYRDFLDNQNELDKLNKIKNKNLNNTEDQQLLLPAYFYPNLPIPVYHKARDSILASKKNEEYFGKDMQNFFRNDVSNRTLVDYGYSGAYLGDSKLRHNPITCPVNDYYYNKYVNKMKKNSEVVDDNIMGAGNYTPKYNNGFNGNFYDNRSNVGGPLTENGRQIVNK